MADRDVLGPAARAIAASLALWACAAGALGCGKTNPTVVRAASAPSTSPAPPTTAPGGSGAAPPQGGGGSGAQSAPLSRARASAFASAVNLRAADVPGFARTNEPAGRGLAPNKPLEQQLAHCAGALGGDRGGPPEQSSPQFARSRNEFGERVSSSVSFLRSEAKVPEELRALRSEQTRGCLSAYLQSLLSGRHLGGGASVGRVSIVQGTPPAPGTSGGFGWRVTAVARAGSLRVPFYLDILGFVYRRSEVTLLSSGAVVPFPAAIQQHLYQLLLTRATAQKL